MLTVRTVRSAQSNGSNSVRFRKISSRWLKPHLACSRSSRGGTRTDEGQDVGRWPFLVLRCPFLEEPGTKNEERTSEPFQQIRHQRLRESLRDLGDRPRLLVEGVRGVHVDLVVLG